MALSNLMGGWSLGIGLVFVCLVVAWVSFAKRKYTHAENMAVQRKSRFLSVAEHNLFGCLVEALSDNYFIFARVRMQSVIEAKSNAIGVNRIRRQLSGHYFDFVLCRKIDMSIFGVIELEHKDRADKGRSRSLAKREQDTKMIAHACKSANLKLFYFDVKRDYSRVDICRLITGKSKVVERERFSPTHESQLTIDSPSNTITGYARTCPKCYNEVVTKVAVKGRDIGEKFMMCRKYPYCDYRIAMTDVDSIRRLQMGEAIKSRTEGYKDWSAG